MGLVSKSYFENGTTADAGALNTALDTIYDEFNGKIDNSNISATAGIDTSKLGGASTAWTPSLTGWSANPAGVYRYIKIGKFVTCWFRQTSNGTSNATTKTVSLPLAATTITSMQWMGQCLIVDNGGAAVLGHVLINSAGTTASFIIAGATAWTGSGNARIAYGTITYEVA